MRDRNGNRLTVGYDVNGRAHTITDSLGRTVTINYNVPEGGQYGTNTQVVFSGFGGAQRVVRLSQTNLGGALRPGYSLQPHGADATPYDPTVTSSVWLPDGRRYRLLYNDMGELARVELPTGGAIEYDHEGGLQGGDPEGTFEVLPDGSNGHYLHIYRRIVECRLILGRRDGLGVDCQNDGIGGELLAEYQSGASPIVATKEYGYRGGELLVTMSSGDDQRLKRFVTNLYYGALRRDPTPQELQDASN